MSKKNNDYKRYDDYKTPGSYTTWYKNLIFVSEITSAIWVFVSFLKEVFKKLALNKTTSKLSFGDKMRYVSSGFLPFTSYSGENYKNIPLPVAVFVCIISLAVICLFIATAIAILTA